MSASFPLLEKVLNLPTAPLHEAAVQKFISDFCRKYKLSYQKDTYGNLWVHYRRSFRSGAPTVFVAHMDHPGFEIVRGGKRAQVKLLGGVPEKYFLKLKVMAWDHGKKVFGKVMRILDKKKRIYEVLFRKEVTKGSFGQGALAECIRKKDLIHTKAADNLVSVASLLNLLQASAQKKIKTNFICLFTRAEEIGFVGAYGALLTGKLLKKSPILVLEASSAKVGKVNIGGGPVLRVGDRQTSFSPAMDLWFHSVAVKLKKKNKKFQFQRALLQGGRCEASLFCLKGCTVGCITLPLGNYHNAGARSYAMEYISWSDYQHLHEWLLTLAQSTFKFTDVQNNIKKIETHFRLFSNKLRERDSK